jgi:hypothetical protein
MPEAGIPLGGSGFISREIAASLIEKKGFHHRETETTEKQNQDTHFSVNSVSSVARHVSSLRKRKKRKKYFATESTESTEARNGYLFELRVLSGEWFLFE